MKNSIKKIIILTIFLTIISFITIKLLGKTYTVTFITNNTNNYNLLVEEHSGKIKILDEKKQDDKYLIKVQAKKTGKVVFYLDHNGFQEGKELYIHKNLVITDNNYFGKSTGSEIIPISLSIILIYILLLLIKEYRISINENIY